MFQTRRNQRDAMQLERIIQSQGFGTRKQCRELIRSGCVRVEGNPVRSPDARFEPHGLAFEVDGEAWTYRQAAYLMLHKPAGYECSHCPQFHPSIFSLLPMPLVRRGVQAVGRLDQDTTGLLLLSDDGQFVHSWSSGRRKVPKCYRATLKHPVTDALLGTLLEGVLLRDESVPCQAAACRASGSHTLEISVTEGRYHQVKRMIAAAGNRVEALHRRQIGGLELPARLAPGQWEWLAPDLLAALASW